MAIKNEDDIKQLVESDEWMMSVLRAAEELNLPDWWIGAGFLRNKVWNAIGGIDTHSDSDIDLVYFNPDDLTPETDWQYDEKMKSDFPAADWEIRNQARIHSDDNNSYSSTSDGISNWVETATCVAVKLQDGKLKFLFCYGIDDLVNMIVRPIPRLQNDELINIFHDRANRKKWLQRWPNIGIEL